MANFVIEIYTGWLEMAITGQKFGSFYSGCILENNEGNHLSWRIDISTVSFY